MPQQPLHIPDNDEEKSKKIARVDVRGKNLDKWARIKPKLMAKIDAFLDFPADHSAGTTVRDEAKQLTSALLDFAKNRLAREGAEVQKIEAEISEIYAKERMALAQADKLNAEAEAMRSQNAIKELVAMLALTKAMLVGEEGEEALLLGKQIDVFLDIVKELGLISGA